MVAAPPFIAASNENTQSKTARDDPAPLRSLKRWGFRSALGDERRHVDRRAVEIPAHAELEVVRGDVPELDRRRAGSAVVVRAEVAGIGVAEIHVAVGEFDGEAGADLVGETGMGGPGEIPLTVVGEVGHAVGEPAGIDPGAVVTEAAELVVGTADTGADEGGDAPPGAEIDI